MTTTLTDNDRLTLLSLARSTITARLLGDKGTAEQPANLSPMLKEKRGCFVTLHKAGCLRGCIGTIEPVTELFCCVKENAINAAFRDPRFPSLKKDELDAVEIEISVLTVPRELKFRDGENLKQQLIAGRHGVILEREYRRSTFLPQVWEQLPRKEDFLAHLCLKGGMARDAWKDPQLRAHVYEAEHFSEAEMAAM